MTAILSAAVEIYPHQVHTVMKVLQDPVQRYLLADEVGLGKTIEAGLIVRQMMLDRPDARIAVLAPDMLRRQWQREFREKFFVDDFSGATLQIGAHETPERWSDYRGFDLVVVDEAHRVVQGGRPGTSPYQELVELATSVPRILLLTATPATADPDMHLGLLHLLAPSIYRWNDRTAFARRLETRQQLADALFALDGDFAFLLEPTLQQIIDIVPDDPLLKACSRAVLDLLDGDGELADPANRGGLDDAIGALRAHVSETYRLHRRIIRHRRSAALTDSDEASPYEIRGRRRPVTIPVGSGEHDAAQEALLDWQGGVADYLLDEGRTADRAAYGQVLAVLVTRAGGPVDDLAAALSWRIRGNAEAADRAGLTVTERAELRAPDVAAAEHRALAALEEARGGSAAADLAESLAPVLRRARHAIVFCGPGTLAGVMTRELPGLLPEGLRVHEHTRTVGGEGAEQAVLDWTTGQGVLVVDDSGDDGLNLQIADLVVHCRLPRSPNVLEQRLGRVDRYVLPRPAAPTGPAGQFLLAQADGAASVSGAWATLLGDGYRIFDSSLSSLRDAIEASLNDVWAAGLERGPSGLTDQASTVAGQLAEERRQVEAADLIESVFGTTAEADATTAALDALEADWRTIRSTVNAYALDGLRLVGKEVDGERIVRFHLGAHEPRMPPRLLAHGGRVTADAMREGAFNRSVALRRPGTRVFRIGHPFVDLLATVMGVDDRGQAAAFWRTDQTHTGDPEVFFGVDFLVEASLQSAAELLEQGHPGAQDALRRQADRLFPPFIGRAWVRAGAGSAFTDRRAVGWLDRPFNKTCGDLNLNPSRFSALIDLFGTRERFAQTARHAEGIAGRDLARVTDLAMRSATAVEQGRGQIEVLRAQALARRAAGDLVGDADAYTLDVGLTEAFLYDLGAPTVRPIGATCIVRGGVGGMARVEG